MSLKLRVFIPLIILSGCDRMTRGVDDERRLQMDCEMETPDGTVMRCRQDLEKNIDTDDDSISIKGVK